MAAKKPEKKAEKKEPKKETKPAKKEAPKKAAKPAKKEAPKKEAKPAKKEAAKKEAPKKEVKKSAAYHISKREDGMWQVFRAGSDKVIKLFKTKAEAEEYTKKMAENQGVVYHSHASKGKNKGKIQK